jgi:2-octaprenyl-6-methoxyphenol hydroxylase
MSTTTASACIVVGTGPAGLATALALGAVGANAVLAGPPAASAVAGDTRTAALFTGSIALLDNLGVWAKVRSASAPLKAIRIVDDTGRLLRAPEVLFEAREIGLEAFGWNVPNAALAEALWAAVRRDPRIAVVETARVTGVDIEKAAAIVRTAEGHVLRAPLLAAADGRGSICRAAAGIATTGYDYDQAAIATRFDHGRAHDGVSTEFHRPGGPLTTVPMPGRASSLVWVERPAVARHLAGLGNEPFRAVLEARLQGLLGRVIAVGPRRLFPLGTATAASFAQNRVALVGEAAHVIPPIGAQGLNLGLRDAATLAGCVADALRRGDDPGAPETLRRYHEARAGDVASRSLAVDALNRTLLSTLLPVSLMRGLGLHVIRAVGPLKRSLIRQGLEPPGPRPPLMEPGGGGLIEPAAGHL